MPILISTPQDLNNIRNNLSGEYELTNDIDMKGIDWTPISYFDEVTWISGFTGKLDGKGYKIKNLVINKTKGIYIGLFGQSVGATFKNIAIENPIININNNGLRFTGALIGFAYDSTIENCYSNGGNLKAQDDSGGLIGKCDNSIISDSYSSNNITLNTQYYGGGFVGTIDSNSIITNCYSVGRVQYTQTSTYQNSSGFAGFIRPTDSISLINCYFDKEMSTQLYSPHTGIKGKSSLEMKNQVTYVGWDFSKTWGMKDYPYLRVFGLDVIVKQESRNLTSILKSIDSHSSKQKKTKREMNSYHSPFETDIFTTLISVKRDIRNLKANINRIQSTFLLSKQSNKNVQINIGQLQSRLSVSLPINVLSPNAYLSIANGISRGFKIEDSSFTFWIHNQSYLEVRK